ncbi:MAG: TIGR00730 family Rossman fold protein [Bacteroidetes bacterium]|jgi:cytokinin riboside 5'-monophosphate phosphoribohydrolase|nr:TIGR00730 family Rossman fold protein [Bacteroidota bacterium]MBT3800983.1 TIGR00730 family Rossman fold protein [Bacteroidota bacterium]MBT3935377.1 TIGR00730 family Rossman fold protein [Bacteroidota bacterium]MBT4728088.1 TIGR00730 family Rossman fold protein [Bacteroidota bacterium]MBT4970705.1 TIGR00730 family Rossman fold protein [Bacteroidota bacterium]
MNICLFASSSKHIDQKYFDTAAELGNLIGQSGHTLIHGGGKEGLMGKVADHVQLNKGKVIGVIPEKLNQKGIVRENDEETIVTKTMAERKAIMFEMADLFIALPGGFGTLEELLEIITLNQLAYLKKKVIIFNTHGYYDLLIQFFEQIVNFKFSDSSSHELFTIANSLDELSIV